MHPFGSSRDKMNRNPFVIVGTALVFAWAPTVSAQAASFGEADPAYHGADVLGYGCDIVGGAVAAGPDQSFYATLDGGPTFYAVARWRPDGSFDPTWGGVGRVAADAIPTAILTLPDGRIDIVTAHDIERFNADGTPDASFGSSGHSAPLDTTGPVSAALGADGSVVVLGTRTTIDPYLGRRDTLVFRRVAADGSLDRAFGDAGSIAPLVPAPGAGALYAWSVLSDGSVEVGTYTVASDGVARPELHRYPDDFASDPGRVMPHVGVASWLSPTVAIDGSGAALFASAQTGASPGQSMVTVTRYTADGRFDTGFVAGGHGRIAISGAYADLATSLAPKMLWQSQDGRWVVLTRVEQSDSAANPTRASFTTEAVAFLPNGAPDSSFPQGVVIGANSSMFAQRQDGSLLQTTRALGGCSSVKQLTGMPRADAPMIEYYHAGLDHYFMTLENEESRALDANVATWGWVRTGRTFGAWLAGNPSGATDLCRFYGTNQVIGPNSHFFAVKGPECDGLLVLAAQTPLDQRAWRLEGYAASVTAVASAGCPANLTPVRRLYNDGASQGRDPNHRYVTDPALYAQMQAQRWIGEGTAFCVPPPSSRVSAF